MGTENPENERVAAEESLRHREAEIQRSRDSLRQLTHRTDRLIEEERKQIARELHDQMGSDLTTVKIDLQLAREDAVAAAAETAVEHIDAATKVVDSMAGSMRALAARLRPAVLDVYGLPAAIEWQADQFRGRAACEVEIDVDDGIPELAEEQATALFRICQEALTNVLRHAGASRVSVVLCAVDGAVVLTISDDGRGLAESRLRTGRPLGVLGMQERARAAGGRLEIGSPPAGGTEVRVVLTPQAPGAEDSRP